MALEVESISADADVLMNLLATNCAVEILRDLRMVLLVSPAVSDESIYLESADASGDRAPIDLRELEQAGVLQKTNLSDEKLEFVIELARQVDDGEAEAISVGMSRRVRVATDDRKARRAASDRGNALLSTPDMLHDWQAAANISDAKMSSVLRLIGRRSRFRPPADHGLYAWWMQLLILDEARGGESR